MCVMPCEGGLRGVSVGHEGGRAGCEEGSKARVGGEALPSCPGIPIRLFLFMTYFKIGAKS